MFRSLDDHLPSQEALSLPEGSKPIPDESQNPAEESTAIPWIYGLLLLSLAFIPLNRGLARFDTTTELYPNHAWVENLCYWFTALFTILVFVLAAYTTRAVSLLKRIALPFLIAMQVAGGLFMATERIASLIEGAIDFPSGKTHISVTLFPIARAYQTHEDKEINRFIVTTPVWSKLKITPEDYTYMLANRQPENSNPDDPNANHDYISNFRYFCAKVTIEQTGKALRILHAGSHELPKGSVVLCPASLANPPAITP